MQVGHDSQMYNVFNVAKGDSSEGDLEHYKVSAFERNAICCSAQATSAAMIFTTAISCGLSPSRKVPPAERCKESKCRNDS